MLHKQGAPADPPGCEEYNDIFARHGYAHDEGLTVYLRIHYERFVKTRALIYENWSPRPGQRMLDVGAHWLHQALLYALDGFEVIAADLPDTLSHAHVRRLAEAHGMTVVAYEDLSRPAELAPLADDSVDLILFSEIIEHITFNPVAMWREFYRLLRPGGRVVVTTPNYYALDARAWDWRRLLHGGGTGITVGEILVTPDTGPHWKEFSAAEVREYFLKLSPDFVVSRTAYLNCYPPKSRYTRFMQERFEGLRQNLHVEIDLPEKRHGIVITPHW